MKAQVRFTRPVATQLAQLLGSTQLEQLFSLGKCARRSLYVIFSANIKCPGLLYMKVFLEHPQSCARIQLGEICTLTPALDLCMLLEKVVVLLMRLD